MKLALLLFSATPSLGALPDACADTRGKDAKGWIGDVQQDTHVRPPIDHWTKHEGTNCYKDHGGMPIFNETGGDSAISQLTNTDADVRESVYNCMDECRRHTSCNAIVYTNHPNPNHRECYLRESVDVEQCQTGAGEENGWASKFDTYVMPPSAKWNLYENTDCRPGFGGDAVSWDDSDDSKGHSSVIACMQECHKVEACSAIVFKHRAHVAKGQCFLRENLVLSKCGCLPSLEIAV